MLLWQCRGPSRILRNKGNNQLPFVERRTWVMKNKYGRVEGAWRAESDVRVVASKRSDNHPAETQFLLSQPINNDVVQMQTTHIQHAVRQLVWIMISGRPISDK